jgi:Protein of unknown function (DUF1549)/Protein of unknown function (DUF1553)/Planctomycete cytochrome C
MRGTTGFRCVLTLTLLVAAQSVCRGEKPKSEPSAASLHAEFFENKVRPLLVRRCFKCHSGKKPKGNLRLDSRAAMLHGGDSGPAIKPGSPEKSLLVSAVNYRDLEMPPGGKLSAREIAVLTRWVKLGAPWPNDRPTRVARNVEFKITKQDRNYWAFRPVARPPLPVVRNAAWVRNPIDAFILAKLEKQGLQPNPPANRRELIRRLYFDLIGLPPTPEEVVAFLADRSPNAYEKIVDRLLARKEYGERWGRHWLDVVRFGQTNGYERDDEKPNAWRYRDYVIRAFNDDKPYDRFIREQLAGDELDDVSAETIIATGYYRLGVWDDEPDDKRRALYDELDEVVRTTGAAFLGLTVGCARCHNHMFDPIPQRDYYRFAAVFRNVLPYGRDKKETHWEINRDAVLTPLRETELGRQWERRIRALLKRRVQVKARLAVLGKDDPERKKLDAELAVLNNQSLSPPMALSVREPGTYVEPTFVLIRGEPTRRGEEVQPGVPAVLGGNDLLPRPPKPKPSSVLQRLREKGLKPTSGRRRALADWIASRRNPLTARVMVNRIWQHHFGRGIVRTANNFGKAGVPPTHPVLLDWLAAEFMGQRRTGSVSDRSSGTHNRRAWSIKAMHRLIVTSNAYRISSRADRETASYADPGNDLFWRQNMRRLDAESLRDAILFTSGRLNPAMRGRGLFPALSKEVLATQSRPGSGWGHSDDRERCRRSVYIYIKRTLMVPLLEVFDYTNTAEPLGVRPVTTVAPQALMLLNGRFLREQSQALAERLMRDRQTDKERITRLFQLCLQRPPTEAERRIATKLLHDAVAELARVQTRDQNASNQSIRHSPSEFVRIPLRGKEQCDVEALRSLCLVVLNLNEFIYVD